MTEDEAKKRFITLNLFRLVSLVLTLFGIYIFQTEMLGPDLNWIGAVFTILGAAEFFLAPMILKKMWNKQDK